jgi:hypothetical protein
VAKVNPEVDKCQVEGMQYILLDLVYFGGIIDYSMWILGESIIFLHHLEEQKSVFCCNYDNGLNLCLEKSWYN